MDSAGAVVAGATVTVSSAATNLQRTVTTNSSGNYTIPALLPGIYTLRVEMPGFATYVRPDIELQVAQVARIDVTLQVGNVSEVIEVKGGAPLLETDNTSLGTVIENQRILDLPLNGRNYLQLAALTPGATTAARPSFVAGLRQGGTRSLFALSVSGQRLFFNRYLLDGLENTSPNWQSYIFLPSLDALLEFKVEQGITPAEYGKNMTQINVSTKSGTNELHGTAWEFLRNNYFDARNFFDPRTGKMPAFRRNQFGFTLGGPVVLPKIINGRNRLFFMVNYEGLRERKALVQPATVPPWEWVNGNFTAVATPIYDVQTRVYNAAGTAVLSSTPFPGNILPRSRIAPISFAYMRDWMPRVDAANVVANNFTNTEGRPTDNNQQNARFDFIQSSAINWFFRYSHAGEKQYNPIAIPRHGTDVVVQAHQGMLAQTWVLGANKVNNFRAGVSRFENSNVPPYAGVRNVVKELGIPLNTNFPLYWGIPNVNFGAGFTSTGNSADSPFINFDTMIQASNQLTWTYGKHNFKFGGEITRTRFNQLGGVTTRGRFTVNGQYSSSGIPGQPIVAAHHIADWMQGLFSISESQDGVPIANYRNWYFAGFFQDTWRVTQKLTINYGLRWEQYGPWVDKHDNIINIDLRWDNSIFPTFVRAGRGDPFAGGVCCRMPDFIPTVRDGRFGRTTQKNQWDNFGPRLGIAYSLTSKTVFRAGAGIYYVQEIQNKAFEVVRNAPLSIRRDEPADALRPNLTWNNLSNAQNIPSLSFSHEWDAPRPRVGQWSAGFQHQLAEHMGIEVNYLGASGMYLEGPGIMNQPPPGPGNLNLRRPFPMFLGIFVFIESAYHSSYHSMQARFQHKPARGLNLLSSFTWGKSIDNNSAYRIQFGDGAVADPYNKHGSRALSAFDHRRNWTTSLLYELPFGKGKRFLNSGNKVLDFIVGRWQTGTILTLIDGFPYSALCGTAAVQNGGNTCYPDVVDGEKPNLPRGKQDPRRWSNPNAFVNRLPNAGFRYGTAGRNVLTGPGTINWDFSMQKDFRINERHNLEFRTEIFNFPNHPLFGLPSGAVQTPAFGVISSTAQDNRQIQLALRYSF